MIVSTKETIYLIFDILLIICADCIVISSSRTAIIFYEELKNERSI